MIRLFKSIKGRLFLLVFTVNTMLLVVLGISVKYVVTTAIITSIDESLEAQSNIVTGLLHMEHGEIEFELAEVISGEYVVPRSGRYYQVFMNGKIFAYSPSLVDPHYEFAHSEMSYHTGHAGDFAFSSIGPNGERVRGMKHEFEFIGIPTSVVIAESIEGSLAALHRVEFFLFIVTLLGIATAGITSLWIVGRAFRPIDHFSEAVSRISHTTLDQRLDMAAQADELAGLSHSFNGMLDRLEKAFVVERRIISDASHELKTPLSVMKAQCDVVLQKPRPQEEYVEALGTIQSSVKSMTKLTQNLLSLARLDSGILSFSHVAPVNVNDVIQESVKTIQVLADRSGIALRYKNGDDISIVGSREKLAEALVNILENAIAYNAPGGSVDVSAQRNGTSAEVKICDTGIGINDNEMEQIFERFYRADESRSTEGAGLGLSIAKSIVKAHNGRIVVESTVDKGSCFTLVFPLASL